MARLNNSIHHLLTEDVLTVLFSKKIYTVTDFVDSEVKILTKITNITYKEIVDLKKYILCKYSATIEYGDVYYNKLINSEAFTTTNIKNFDELIGRGLEPGLIYEICGFASTGKTQFCLTVALNISQYHEKNIYFIDTKRDFSTKRLQTILENRNCDEGTSANILNRIKVKQINDKFELISALYDIKNELLNNIECPLIIIDSLPATFYHTGNYNSTLSTMNHFVSIMRYISVELKTSFLLTNIMILKSATNVSSSSSFKPGLGTYWVNVPSTRFLIKKNNDNICQLTVLKSTTIECDKYCEVTITKYGIV